MDEIRPPKPLVEFDDFAKLDLRVARVLECREHPNADKLLVLKVDLGLEQRQICAMLKGQNTSKTQKRTQTSSFGKNAVARAPRTP